MTLENGSSTAACSTRMIPTAATAPAAASPGALKRALKRAGIALGLVVVALPAASCWLESRFPGHDEIFLFWGQFLALIPGLPGKYLRKCFYYLALNSCSLSCDINFMSYFSDRRARVGHRVYVGFSVSIGAATLGDGCLIGSRVSIMNGGQQHELGLDGRLTAFDRASARPIRIGAETWIGEAAVLLADVGRQCIVAAGGVVSSPVPDGYLVGGNPARFIRKIADTPADRPGQNPDGAKR